jgi:septum formation protein
LANELPLDYLHRIVRSKIGKEDQIQKDDILLACDTIVVQGDKILHKPKDSEEAYQILMELNGNIHSVFSGCVLYSKGEPDYFFEESKIQFQRWSSFQIQEYIHRCHPMDKAGAYGIQDLNGPVKRWEGSYTNVMGFPIRSFYQRGRNGYLLGIENQSELSVEIDQIPWFVI